MDESRLKTIEQIAQFLSGSVEVKFSAYGNDEERYAHISRVLSRFDYHRRSKRERGVLLAYLRQTSGYSRPQVNRLVARWHTNRTAQVPLRKLYAAPRMAFAYVRSRGPLAGKASPFRGMHPRSLAPASA